MKFDTLALFHSLRAIAKLDVLSAKRVMRLTANHILASLDAVSAASISKSDFEKMINASNADFNTLRSDLGLVEKNDFLTLKSDVERLAAELEKFQLRSAEEFRRIQTNTRLELSIEKSRIRDEQNSQEIQLKEADAKIESELASIKTLLEGMRWDLFRTLFPLFSAAGALAFS